MGNLAASDGCRNNTPDHAIGYAKHRSRLHRAMTRVYDDADNVNRKRTNTRGASSKRVDRGAFRSKLNENLLRFSVDRRPDTTRRPFRIESERRLGRLMSFISQSGSINSLDSVPFGTKIGSWFHRVFCSIGAIIAFLFYGSVALTAMAVFVAAFSLYRFFIGLVGREPE